MKYCKYLKNIGACSFFLSLMVLPNLACADDDEQVWTALDYTYFKSKKLKASLYAETRFSNDLSGLAAYFIGPRVGVTLSDHWRLGGAYKSIHIKRGENFDDLYRFELELVYRNRFSEALKYDLRNRIESIHEDGKKDKTRYRTRFRLQKVLNGNSSIKSIFFSEELLYSKTNGSYHLDQNRLIPFGVNLNVGDAKSLSLYYMYLLKNNNQGDDDIHILGGMLLF